MVKFKKTFSVVLFIFFFIATQARGRAVSQLDVKGGGLHYDGRKDKNEETATFFLKDNNWTDPYACTCGLGDDPIC